MNKKDLQQQLKDSMMAKNVEKTSVLRMLISAITYYEIQKGGAGYVATDEDVLSVIQKEAKQRKDSITEYQKANRQDLVDKETGELEMLQQYLPTQLSEDEIEMLVRDAIAKTNASGLQDLGKVMSMLVLQTKGKADGAVVSRIVREHLSK